MSKGYTIILKAKVEAEIFYSDAIKWDKHEKNLNIFKRIVAEGVHRKCDSIDGRVKYFFGVPTPSRQMSRVI